MSLTTRVIDTSSKLSLESLTPVAIYHLRCWHQWQFTACSVDTGGSLPPAVLTSVAIWRLRCWHRWQFTAVVIDTSGKMITVINVQISGKMWPSVPLIPAVNLPLVSTIQVCIAGPIGAPLGNVHYKREKNIQQFAAFFQLIETSPQILLNWAETEIHWIKDDGNIKKQTNFDRWGPRQIPKDCYHPDLPSFSLKTIFKELLECRGKIIIEKHTGKNLVTLFLWVFPLSHTHIQHPTAFRLQSAEKHYRIHTDNLEFLRQPNSTSFIYLLFYLLPNIFTKTIIHNVIRTQYFIYYILYDTIMWLYFIPAEIYKCGNYRPMDNGVSSPCKLRPGQPFGGFFTE